MQWYSWMFTPRKQYIDAYGSSIRDVQFKSTVPWSLLYWYFGRSTRSKQYCGGYCSGIQEGEPQVNDAYCSGIREGPDQVNNILMLMAVVSGKFHSKQTIPWWMLQCYSGWFTPNKLYLDTYCSGIREGSHQVNNTLMLI